MATTNILEAEYWTAGQAQPEVNVNESFDVFDAATAGAITVNASADSDQTLVTTGSKPQQWMFRRVILTDTDAHWTSGHNVIVPTNAKEYVFTNLASTGYDATLKTAAGSGVVCPNGASIFCRCDGTDIVQDLDLQYQYSSSQFTDSEFSGTQFNGYTETYASVSIVGGVATMDVSANNVFNIVLNANTSVEFSAVASTSNQAVTATLFVEQDGTGGRTMTVKNAIYASGAASVVATGAGQLDVWTFITKDGGTTWYGMAGGRNFT